MNMLIILLLHIILVEAKAPYELSFTKSIYNTIHVNTYVGSHLQNLDLSVTFCETFIGLNSRSKYETYKSSSHHVIYATSNGITFTDLVQFSNNNKSFSEIPMILFNKNQDGRIGYIGLAPRKGSVNETLLEHIFSQIPNSKKIMYVDYKTSKIGFGDYPTNKNNLRNYKYCSLLTNLNDNSIDRTGFYCNLDMIYYKFDNKYVYYQFKTPIKFCVEANAIYCPREYIDFLADTYFKDAINKKQCIVVHNEEGYTYINCHNNYNYKSLPNWTIVFDNFSFKLTPEDLFTTVEGDLFFLICNSPNRNVWFFGYPVLKKFLTIFDLEKMQLQFVPQ